MELKVEYQEDLNNKYVILETEYVEVSNYQRRMILSNNIQGILPCGTRSIDDKTCFCYRISERKSLQMLLEETPADLVLVQNLITSILEVQNICAEYLLNTQGILLLPEYIFFADGRFDFCYLPT